MSCRSEKYGELSPLLGPIYYRYGDTLLASVEESAEALGEANATDSVEKAESQNEDEEDGDDEDNADNSATAIEEDLTEKEVQDETNPDDLQVAWECLDVARVIYEKLGESASIELSQIYLRLGDCHMESDTFDKAVEEYSKCLALRAPRVPRYDRYGIASSTIYRFPTYFPCYYLLRSHAISLTLFSLTNIGASQMSCRR